MKHSCFLLVPIILCAQFKLAKAEVSDTPQMHRIIVSTDIGGTDPDDFQSMVHLLLYADTFDIEGIISSPFGDGRASHILEVIAEYEKDYPKIVSYSSKYPTPDSLRKTVKQGATEKATPIGYASSTEGSDWIIECAKRDDSRPLHILVWGGIEDLAQALHDAPEILPKLRVYWIGGPNKKWSVNAFQYIVENFPGLWMIESNAAYRGWFTGGNQSGEWSNTGFVKTYVKDFGALGNYFNSKKSEVKMGDTPSLMRLFYETVPEPYQPSWGGQFVRAWERPHKVFNRTTTYQDSIEQFGVLELLLKFDATTVTDPVATLNIDRPIEALVQNDTVRFLFSPKKVSRWDYTISSNIPSINNLSGKIISTMTPASNKDNPSPLYTNWWTDDPSPEYIESGHIGAKTVNIWRKDFLTDFANRMYRCAYFPNTYFELNTSATNGSITQSVADTAYLAGSKITITAVPDGGYEFLRWEGDISGTDPEIVVTMNSDKNIIAKFTIITSMQGNEYEEIDVFPTKINDFVSVSIPNHSQTSKCIDLFDLSGKLLKTYNLYPEQDKLIINTSSLMTGMFIIRVSYG
jgi:hypothetical protein